jgi:hypothetical protein
MRPIGAPLGMGANDLAPEMKHDAPRQFGPGAELLRRNG